MDKGIDLDILVDGYTVSYERTDEIDRYYNMALLQNQDRFKKVDHIARGYIAHASERLKELAAGKQMPEVGKIEVKKDNSPLNVKEEKKDLRAEFMKLSPLVRGRIIKEMVRAACAKHGYSLRVSAI